MVRVYLARLPKEEATHEEQSAWAHKLLDMALIREYPGLAAPLLLEKDERGKPFLPKYPQIHVSISHSGSCAACAIGEKPVGVDVEQWKKHRKRERLVEKFHPKERELYVKTEEAGRERLFFDLWVLKESFGKALGKGLGIPLDASCMEAVRGGTGMTAQSLSPEAYYWHLYETGVEACSLAVCSQEAVFAEPVWLTVPEEF